MKTIHKMAAALLMTVFSVGFVTSAAAETPAQNAGWLKKHPRRAEVNARLHQQNKRIYDERKEGEITKQQAAQLHSQDHAIRVEERQMAKLHHGHITRKDRKLLNQQENQVSQQIGQ